MNLASYNAKPLSNISTDEKVVFFDRLYAMAERYVIEMCDVDCPTTDCLSAQHEELREVVLSILGKNINSVIRSRKNAARRGRR